MIEDDLRRRRVAGDIESQGAQRMPREVHVGELVVVAIIHRRFGGVAVYPLIGCLKMTANKKRSPRKPTLLSVAKQAKAAGIEVARYEIEPSGKIVVVTGKGDSVRVEADNPWDEVLAGNGRCDGP